MNTTPNFKVEIKNISDGTHQPLSQGFYYGAGNECPARLEFLDHENKTQGIFMYIKNENLPAILNFMKTMGILDGN